MNKVEKDKFRAYRSENNIKKKKELEDDLFEYYYKLLKGIAINIHTRICGKIEVDELVSAGYEALLIKIKEYDPDDESKCSFKTFCNKRIFGSMWDYIRSIDTIPRSVRIREKLYNNKKIELQNVNTLVSDEKICEQLSWDYNKFSINRNHFISTTTISIRSLRRKDLNKEIELDELYELSEKDINIMSNIEDVMECFNKMADMNKFNQREQYIIYQLCFNKKLRKEVYPVLRISQSGLSLLCSRIKKAMLKKHCLGD